MDWSEFARELKPLLYGDWWDGHDCPRCGAGLLKNGAGDIWCSMPECEYEAHIKGCEEGDHA